MPRSDRTYSDKDIIRFIENNLTETEMKAVIKYIQEGVTLEEVLQPIINRVVSLLERLQLMRPSIVAGFEIAHAIIDGRLTFAIAETNLQFYETMLAENDRMRGELEGIDFPDF